MLKPADRSFTYPHPAAAPGGAHTHTHTNGGTVIDTNAIPTADTYLSAYGLAHVDPDAARRNPVADAFADRCAHAYAKRRADALNPTGDPHIDAVTYCATYVGAYADARAALADTTTD